MQQERTLAAAAASLLVAGVLAVGAPETTADVVAGPGAGGPAPVVAAVEPVAAAPERSAQPS